VKPGWKKGTKITFPEKGNEQPNLVAADLVFVIDERANDVFKRDGNDLIAPGGGSYRYHYISHYP